MSVICDKKYIHIKLVDFTFEWKYPHNTRLIRVFFFFTNNSSPLAYLIKTLAHIKETSSLASQTIKFQPYKVFWMS